MKSFLIVTHKFLTLPDDELVSYLIDKNISVLHINHSFNDAPDRVSKCEYYVGGKRVSTCKSWDFKFLPEPLIYLKELLFTFYYVARYFKKYDYYIGLDGLCVFFGLLLRFFGVVGKVVYWAIDFVPKDRFSSKLKNFIYTSINILGYRNCDEMWDLSPRMQEARSEFLGVSTKDYKSLKVVPYGFWTTRIKTYKYEESDKKKLVFMGHLIEKQGVQLLLQALVLLPDEITLKIIGIGNYKESLVGLSKSLGIYHRCEFVGKIEDIRILEDEIAKCAIAVAPYIKSLDTWTYYADPGKVKTYIACGVPILLTDLPWNSSDIVESKCGFIIQEDPKDIADKVLVLLDIKLNNLYRENCINYSKSYDYEKIFSGAVSL